ncbi:MAG TPA: hypothetical protein VIM14_17415 [Polyangia bacterium]|jgi:rubrerythrin
MSADISQEIFRTLIACRSLELAMAGLYAELSSLHEHDAKMARLWRKTSWEEMNHAAQFSLLLDTMSDTVSASLVEPAALDSVRRAIELTVEEFRLHPPSVREALVTAIDFEEAMNDLHADQLLVFANPRCKRLLAAMMAADSGHVASLRAALGSLG